MILVFCAVIDPAAWIAGPLSWCEAKAAIEQFPVSSISPHPLWTSIPVMRDAKQADEPKDVEFVDLEEPKDPD